MKTTDHILNIPNDPTPWRLFEPAGNINGWAVLWLQGHTSTIEGHSEACERMAEEQHVTHAVLNYAGHGNHPTPLAESVRSVQLTEVIGVYDALVERGYAHIIISGGSFGAYLAALLTKHRTPAGVILRAPANYPDEELHLAYKQARLDDHTHNALETWRRGLPETYVNLPVTALAYYDGPVYVIEHEKDEIIPRNLPLSYFHAAKHGTYIILKDSVHSIKDNTELLTIRTKLEDI